MSRELTAPSERLTAAAQLAAAVVFEEEKIGKLKAIDVGCDHAKLSIYLVQSGICSDVLACDVNDGPVLKAKHNLSVRKFRKEPLEKYITVIKNDGLQGLDYFCPNRIFILGMGGELIADILEKSGFVKNTSLKTAFVVQAMTSEDLLRKYLYENGFQILREKLVKDKGRIYSIILAVYDGIPKNMSACSLILGEKNIENPDAELFEAYADRKIRILNKTIAQLEKNNMPCDDKKRLAQELEQIKLQSLNSLSK